jgi:hypothetical protein
MSANNLNQLVGQDGMAVTPVAPYFMSYNTVDLQVQEYHQLPKDTPLLIVKSGIIASLDAYMDSYALSLSQLVEASNQCAKRERKGPVIIDDKGAMTLLHKLQMRIEQFVQKLSDWDGRTELSILVPFAETILMDSEMIGGTKLVDTSKSRPYVNGLYLIVRHSQNGS